MDAIPVLKQEALAKFSAQNVQYTCNVSKMCCLDKSNLCLSVWNFFRAANDRESEREESVESIFVPIAVQKRLIAYTDSRVDLA